MQTWFHVVYQLGEVGSFVDFVTFRIAKIPFHMFFNNGHIQKSESPIFLIYEILECEIFA